MSTARLKIKRLNIYKDTLESYIVCVCYILYRIITSCIFLFFLVIRQKLSFVVPF